MFSSTRIRGVPGAAAAWCGPVLLLVTVALVLAAPAHALPSAAPGSEGLDREAVDTYVEDYLDRHGLAGAEVAVVKDGEVVHTAGYGEHDHAQTTTDTPMPTGSSGKQMTAFAVLQLVEDGRIDLDDPVVEHLPEFDMADDRVSDITVRQLLSHTSGMPSPIIVAPAEDLTAGVARLHDWQLQADPGDRHLYSNMNYHVAGRLVEVVSGTPFNTYLEQNLFDPLGMDDTSSVNTTRDDHAALEHGHVTAYGTTLPVREMDQLIAGAGGVVSTAEDMARWMAMITNGGQAPGGKRVLSADLLEEAQSPQPGADGYGLGWSTSGPDVDPPRVGHSGATSRYSTQVDVVPGSGYGVVVMLNSFTAVYEHNYAIGSGIVEITDGGSPSPGWPVLTLVDVGLGLLTLLVLALMVRGVRRADRWAVRRESWPAWRYALRQLPQVIGPTLVAFLVLVVPALQDNPSTPVDIIAMWPAAMVLLLALGLSGVVLIATRSRSRLRGEGRRDGAGDPLQPESGEDR